MSQSHQFAIRLTLTDLSLLKLQFQYDCSDSQGELACPDRFQAAHCIKASFFPFFFFGLSKTIISNHFLFLRSSNSDGNSGDAFLVPPGQRERPGLEQRSIPSCGAGGGSGGGGTQASTARQPPLENQGNQRWVPRDRQAAASLSANGLAKLSREALSEVHQRVEAYTGQDNRARSVPSKETGQPRACLECSKLM